MIAVRTSEDVYKAIDELAIELRAAGYDNSADILHHRLHKVAWSTRDELFEELQKILSAAQATVSGPLKQKIQQIVSVIGQCLHMSI
jgi:hypothetical protein